jgi:curli biogenesis system outer membrane secretion channel CsgG
MLFIILNTLLLFPIHGAGQIHRIAVLPFDDGSIQERWWGNYELGKGVSNELVTALLGTKKFRLVEREQVEKILGEQKFSNIAGDQKTAAEVGKILGVKYLVMGRVTEFTTDSQSAGFVAPNSVLGLAIKSTVARVAIDARMVDTTTAEIVTSATGIGEKSRTNLGIATQSGGMVFGSNDFYKTSLGQALRNAINQIATKLATQAYEGIMNKPLTGLIAYVSPARIIINLGANDNIEPGMIFEVQHVSGVIKDPASGEVIDEISEIVAEISVVEVKEKSSTCKIISSQGTIAVSDKVKSIGESNSKQTPDTESISPPASTQTPLSTPKPNPGTGSKGASDWL